MQPTIEILDRIRKNSRDNKEEIFTRLYRYLLRPDLYYLAYKNLYANKGAGTKGVNDDTADGFSKEKVDRIIQSLADGTYTPNPVRRKYIQKKQNSTKKRPLGIPTFTDKLVQEVLRKNLMYHSLPRLLIIRMNFHLNLHVLICIRRQYLKSTDI